MPLLSTAGFDVDYTDDGAGPTVILIHSSVSANRQWRNLIESLKPQYRVLAINLFGYGQTTPWPGTIPQSLYAQAQLVLALCDQVDSPVSLVGHSFGGSVALKAATLLGSRLKKLVLLEPNPFFLLKQNGHNIAYLETCDLRDHMQCFGLLGDWSMAAERFVDYWTGEGSWGAMNEKRRAVFIDMLAPNLFEWDAVMNEQSGLETWRSLKAETLVVSSITSPRPILEIVELFRESYPRWSFATVENGGHMAPLTHPELVNPVVRNFLADG